MGVYGVRSDPKAATYTITVGVAVAIVLLLLNIPALDLIWRVLAIAVLAFLEGLNLAVWANIPKRYSAWRTQRKYLRTLNRTSRLIPELKVLVENMEDVVFGSTVDSLHGLAQRIEQTAEATQQGLGAKVRELASHYQLIRDLAKVQTHWERMAFIDFVRHIGRFFQFIDPFLHDCRELAETAEIDDDVIRDWELFKERYNGLRVDWNTYFGRIPPAIGLSAQLLGEPARSLPRPAT